MRILVALLMLASVAQAGMASRWLGLLAGQESIVPRDGLVAEYLFTTDASDTSGNHKNGTLYGNAAVIGGSLVLDGSGDYMTSDSYGLANNSLTISMWIFPTDLSGSNVYSSINPRFLISGSANVAATPYMLRMQGDALAYVYYSSPAWQVISSGYGALTVNQWNFVAVTHAASVASLYIDGVFVSSKTLVSTDSGEGTIYTGTEAGVQRFFEGKMDDNRYYNRALTKREVSSIYKVGRSQ